MKISAALAVASCALAISVNAAKADPIPYVVTIEQVGSNIVATGGGDFDLTGLTLLSHSGTQTAGAVKPSAPGAGIALSTSPPLLDVYSGISGPTSFGSGGTTLATSSSGPPVVLAQSTNIAGVPILLGVPTGYTSGTLLTTSQDIFANTTLAMLGITPGTYFWTWGSASDQSFTLEIANPVPGPVAGAGLPGLILAGGGLLGW